MTSDFLLPEHAANPFIAGLGPPPDVGSIVSILQVRPLFDPKERGYPAHLRRYCALRLFEWLHPRDCQVELVERIGMAMRLGYAGRNPSTGDHSRAIRAAADRLEFLKSTGRSNRQAKLVRPTYVVESTACGFANLGHPGMGKSRTVRRALGAFSRTLRPDLPYTVVQVPWLHVECPAGGSPKQLCVALISALQRRLAEVGKASDIDYVEIYASRSVGLEQLMLNVELLFTIHAVGIVAIDEVQNLAEARVGEAYALNFLVGLVNGCGVPVLLIGTMAATGVIQRDFRGARRAVGIGSMIWQKMDRGQAWDDLVGDIWSYQWTCDPSPLTSEIMEALYDESQGVLDILVRLIVLCQFRAIALGEVGRDPQEQMTLELIRTVAADELKLVQPFMRALRDGRPEKIALFSDLTSFHAHVDATLMSSGMTGDAVAKARRLDEASKAAEATKPGDPLTPFRLILSDRGYAPDLIEELLKELVRRHPSRDPLEMMATLPGLLVLGPGTKKEAPDVAAKKARAVPTPERRTLFDDPRDLRSIAARARAEGREAHGALVDAGVVRTVAALVGR